MRNAAALDVSNIHRVVVNEFLRKIVHHAFNATAQALGTVGFAGLNLAFNFVSFTLRTWNSISGEANEQLIENNMVGVRDSMMTYKLAPWRSSAPPA
jgi:hypothetical protein